MVRVLESLYPKFREHPVKFSKHRGTLLNTLTFKHFNNVLKNT